MSDRPVVSVVVSTYQRSEALAGLVRALEQQTYPMDEIEVVIVDNGSTDDTSEVLGRLAAASPLKVRAVNLPSNEGSSGGRNAGWRAAKGDVIAFTDDDCLPEPDWLKAGLEAMQDDVDLVQGRTIEQRRIRALERGAGSAVLDGLYPTCNVFYRREALEATGGFDRADGAKLGFRPGSFGSGYGFGEDTMLAWRVARSGKAVFAPDAVVRHAVSRPPIREYIVRHWVVGSFPALVREVPELRDLLLRRKVFLGYRRMPLYATIAALISPYRWIAAATAVWWVVARARDARRRGGSRGSQVMAVPVEMAVDAVSAVALVRGCIRARSFVI